MPAIFSSFTTIGQDELIYTKCILTEVQENAPESKNKNPFRPCGSI